MPAKRRRRRNIQMGFFDATGFHPIRASRDYDPDVDEGDYARPKRRKKKAKRKNPLNPSPRGWVKAKAVKIVRNKRGQAVSVKIRT